MSRINNPMKVITGPETRWSYANVWEPKSINGGAPKYSVSLIIPKSDTKTVEKSRLLLRPLMMKVRVNLRVTAELFLHFLYLRCLCVTEIQKDPMTLYMQTVTLSMLTVHQHPVS